MNRDASFPEFWVSEPPEDSTKLQNLYYKVTGTDPDGQVFWSREGSGEEREGTFYDMMMEAVNGFGLRQCSPDESTPWDNELDSEET